MRVIVLTIIIMKLAVILSITTPLKETILNFLDLLLSPKSNE